MLINSAVFEVKKTPFLKRAGRWIFKWLTWYFPALADILADDMGSEYQAGTTLIWIFGSVLMAVLPLTIIKVGGTFISAGGAFVGVYLLFGLAYLLHEKSWGN